MRPGYPTSRQERRCIKIRPGGPACGAVTGSAKQPTTRKARDNRTRSRRYLQPDFRCLCCKRRSSRASARTRYLQRCLRRTETDVTHVTCVYPLLAAALDVSRLIRTVRRRHVTAAEPLVTGTFSMGTSDNRRSGQLDSPGRPGSLHVQIWPIWTAVAGRLPSERASSALRWRPVRGHPGRAGSPDRGGPARRSCRSAA